MKQEDKELLLKDLCGRLPYGVIIEGLEHPEIMTVKHLAIISVMSAEPYKPYLRPMSSMTEDERSKFYDICTTSSADKNHFIMEGCIDSNHMLEKFDYLNSIHVDYRGLIPMGLAIEVTKENNPYESSIKTD